jgi:hypothetical protein
MAALRAKTEMNTMTLNLRRLVLSSLGLLATSTLAQAGWNSVAHLTCNEPRRSSFKPVETTQPHTAQYESRSYYEPVTVMKKQIEEVPYEVKVKSYYWDPVETYVRRSYYDPCSGQCQQIDVPRTSYVRKEECRTETRYMEKVRMVPVQVQREVTETRPIYTYYGPVQRKYGPTIERTPTTEEFRGAPRLEMERKGGGSDVNGGWVPIPGTNLPTSPASKFESKKPTTVTPPQPQSSFNALTTSMTKKSTGAAVFGDVFKSDKATPATEAKVVFVNAADLNERVYATADAFGSFEATLPAGDWHVYGGPGTGKAELIGKLTTKDGERLQPQIALK